MPRPSARERRREKQRVARSRAAQAHRARRRGSAAAARRGHLSPAHRHLLAYLLWVVATIAGVLDFLVYVGVLDIMSASLATVVLGGPMVVGALAGAVVYGT